MIQLHPGVQVHLVGVGGFGMSAIARILLQRGLTVSGSDRAENELVRQLVADGARVFIGHDAANIAGAQSLIVTSAVNEQHVEVLAARQQGIPVFRRSEMLHALMDGSRCVAVAGTHGKTTTTAMIAHILLTTGHDPSYIVGGVMQNTGDNARAGQGGLFVVEADEYDNAFLGLRPDIAVVTSLEYDHPDFFRTSGDMVASFQSFVDLLNPQGTLIACADNDAASLHTSARRALYGLKAGEWRAQNLRYTGALMSFDVVADARVLTPVTLQVYGEHNVANALAALRACAVCGVDIIQAADALASFRGTGRRFDVRAEVRGVVIIDDYAHHPTAIVTTLDAARRRYPHHTLWAVWQPHTYSRTQELLPAYAEAFGAAHHVLVTDIFASREPFTSAVHSQDVVVRMHHPSARYSGSLADTAALLRQEVVPPAVVLIMSAGDAPRIGVDLDAWLRSQPDELG
jgi:UDP-N-acetylmuramate--alanine ligase